MSGKIIYPPKMKAVFLDKPEGNLVVREVNTPAPGPNEVLIKMKAAPVNPSDLAMIRRAHIDHDLATFIPGIEGCGTVVASGKGIMPKLWMGKRVTCSSHNPESGTWAEYMVTKAGACFPLNSKISDEQASMSLVNPLTALGFFELVKLNNHKAIINNAAASALGRMVELLGKKHKIPIINIVRSPKQVEMLRELGSEYVIDSSDPSFVDNLGILSKKLDATILFDSVCSPQLIKMIDVLPKGSTVIIYGNLSGEEQINVNPRCLIDNDIKIAGFYLANRAKENSLFRNIMNLREVSRLMRSDLIIKIQGNFPLEKAQEAVNTYLANMSAGKVLLMA
jgi:NADPH:quinone reductase